MKFKILVLSLVLSFMSVYLMAKGNIAVDQPAIEITMELTDFKFTPNMVEMETGKLYKLVLINKGTQKHEIDAPSISHLAYTRKVEITDPKGNFIAEVKGFPAEMEIGVGQQVVWYFVPIQTTDGPVEFVCLLPGHYEAGMHGMIEFK